MTFSAILSDIMLFHINLNDIINLTRCIFGMTHRAKFTALWNPHGDDRIRGIDMREARTMAGFARQRFMHIRRLQVGNIMMTIRTGLLTGISGHFGLILNKRQSSVVAEFSKGFRPQKMPGHQEKPDKYGEEQCKPFNLRRHSF